MKKLFLLCFIFIVSPFSFNQTVDGNFVVMTNNEVTYSVKVQIKLQSGSQNLGNATIRFSFNNGDLSFPSPPVEGTDYLFHNFQGGDYSSSVSRPQANTVSINIAYIGGSGTTVNTSSIDVVTINFSTIDPLGNSNLIWGTRELFTISSATAWSLGNWPNENTIPLPVELNSFNAIPKGISVELTWETKTEVDNYGFEIERKVGSSQLGVESWENIGFVNGNGNSNSTKNYSFTDKNLSGGSKFIYRLKQIDNDGDFSYSDEVEVELIPDKYVLFQNYPNPFNPVTNIKFSLPVNSKVRLDVYNIIGEHVITLIDKEMEPGFYVVPFNAANLSSGTYIYRIQAQDFSQTKKMLLIK